MGHRPIEITQPKIMDDCFFKFTWFAFCGSRISPWKRTRDGGSSRPTLMGKPIEPMLGSYDCT